MKMLNYEQRSEEWLRARCGLPTSSNFDKIITIKGEQSKQREKFLMKTAGEKIIGSFAENYQNEYMLRGIELEEEARKTYEFITDNVVYEASLCIMDDDSCGSSPDGFVGEDGLLEIKCPKMETHIEYLLNNKLPSAYFQQVQGQLYVTGRKWCDFMSYYPSLKPFIIRVLPDKEFHNALEKEIKAFNEDLKVLINKIK